MARAHPKAGSAWRLAHPTHGVGPGALYAGQEVTVDEVVPADEPGAHDDTEAAVVVSFTEPTPVADAFTEVAPRQYDDDGNVVAAEVLAPDGVTLQPLARRVAFGLADFHAKFEEV